MTRTQDKELGCLGWIFGLLIGLPFAACMITGGPEAVTGAISGLLSLFGKVFN